MKATIMITNSKSSSRPRAMAASRLLPALVLLCASLLFHPPLGTAQGFSSGSTGADGDLVVTNHLTLDLPPDGIFHFNTITVDPGIVLSFKRNPLNTPVYLLARSNVTINGRIDVSGKQTLGNYRGGEGGPGGYDGGEGGLVSGTNVYQGGSGKGPGGGLRGDGNNSGYGAFRLTPTEAGRRHGTNYGNPLLIPLIGGSGGGGRDGNNIHGGGGGGGGAILIASDTLIRINTSGDILNRGASLGGSGGAIRLVSPRVYGNGGLYVEGSGNGHGYIRIDSILKREPNDHTQFFALGASPSDSMTLGANMVVFPPNLPRLDVVAIGTNVIPFGTGSPQFFFFPIGSATNQTVTVEARNFNTNAVPIEVALIPDSGEKTTFLAVIDNSSNPGQVIVPVTVTPNTKVEVQAWTR